MPKGIPKNKRGFNPRPVQPQPPRAAPTIHIAPEQREFHSADVRIEQKPPIVDHTKYDGDIIAVDPVVVDKEYLAQLAFNEEPVTIRLEPSAEKNAARMFHTQVNGKGIELLIDGKWVEYGWAPIGQVFTTKRKYLAVIASAKKDAVDTWHDDAVVERPRNEIRRNTSSATGFSVIRDQNPAGAEWLTEVLRRAG